MSKLDQIIEILRASSTDEDNEKFIGFLEKNGNLKQGIVNRPAIDTVKIEREQRESKTHAVLAGS